MNLRERIFLYMDLLQSLFIESEAPRLAALIKKSIDRAGSAGAWLSAANTRLAAQGLEALTESQLYTMQNPPKSQKHWSSRKIARVAIGLGLDPDPRFALSLMRMHLLGLVDIADIEAVARLRSLLLPTVASAGTLLDAVEQEHPGAYEKLYKTTPLTEIRLNEIRLGAVATEEECDWLVSWARGFDVALSPGLLKLPVESLQVSSELHQLPESTKLPKRHT